MTVDLARIEALTFDCYGTLIDWEAGLLGALRPILAAHGAALGDEGLLELYAELESRAEEGPYRSYRRVLREVLAGVGRRLGFHPTVAESDAFAACIRDWEPFPDSTPALRTLASRFRLAVISNVDDGLFAWSGERLDVTFDWVIAAQQVGSYKPSPRNFEQALRRIGRARDRVLHCAQSLFHDIGPARAMGLATVWVDRRGGGGATPPARATPDLRVAGLAELAKVLLPGDER